MENASKALIIAGAILLAILLISLGMMVLNKATGILDNQQLDEAAVSTFNEKFSKYEGPRVRGSNVRSLISEVTAYNGSDDATTSSQFINIHGSGNFNGSAAFNVQTTNGTVTGTGGIVNTRYYSVEIQARANGGKVSEIVIGPAQ